MKKKKDNKKKRMAIDNQISLYAFRYILGKTSSSVLPTIDFLIMHVHDFNADFKKQIVDEIGEYKEKHKVLNMGDEEYHYSRLITSFMHSAKVIPYIKCSQCGATALAYDSKMKLHCLNCCATDIDESEHVIDIPKTSVE